MAAAAFIKAAEDELSCPVCLELFVGPHVPKDLPGCDHIVCKVCLKKMVKDLKAPARINCPECRHEITLPKGGINSFKTNRKLRNLAEKHPRDLDVTILESLTIYDVTEPISAAAVSLQGAKPKVQMCPDHVEEQMHFYCRSCDKSACLACLILKHPGHNIEGVAGVYAHQQQKMKAQLMEAKRTIEKCKKNHRELTELKTQVGKSQEAEEQKIDKCLEETVGKFQALKTELQKAGQEKQRYIAREITEVDQNIKEFETIYTAVSSVYTNATEYEYVAQHDFLDAKLELIGVAESYHKLTNFSGRAAAVFVESKQPVGTLLYKTPVKTPREIVEPWPEQAELGTPKSYKLSVSKPAKLKLIQTITTLTEDKVAPGNVIAWSPNGMKLAV